MYKALPYLEPLNPKSVVLHREPGKTDGLCLTISDGAHGERTFRDVSVRRAFPISGADQMVSFVDREGHEIGVLVDPRELDPTSYQVLQAAMEVAYFIPKITKILALNEEYGLRWWRVETDRGPREFATQSRYDVRAVGNHRYVIRDVDGNRYEIPDLLALDAQSRMKIDMEL